MILKRVLNKFNFSIQNLDQNNFVKIKNFESLKNKIIDQNIDISEKEFSKNYKRFFNNFNNDHLSNNILVNNPVLMLNDNIDIFNKNSIIFFEKYNILDENDKKRCTYSLNKYFINDSNLNILFDKINYLKLNIELNDLEVEDLLRNYPEAFNYENEQLMETKKLIYQFGNLSNEEINTLMKNWPFFINFDNVKLKRNFILLTESIQNYKSIHTMLTKFPLPLLYSVGYFTEFYLLLTTKIFKTEEDRQKLIKILENHPHMYFQDLTNNVYQKFNLFKKEFEWDYSMIRTLIKYYPDSFCKGIENWKLKIKYLKRRYNFNFTEEVAFPEIIKYDYLEFIRPRGELMLLNNKILPWEKVLIMDDDKFCNSIGVTLEELSLKKKELIDDTILNDLSKFKTKYWKFMSDKLRKQFEEFN